MQKTLHLLKGLWLTVAMLLLLAGCKDQPKAHGDKVPYNNLRPFKLNTYPKFLEKIGEQPLYEDRDNEAYRVTYFPGEWDTFFMVLTVKHDCRNNSITTTYKAYALCEDTSQMCLVGQSKNWIERDYFGFWDSLQTTINGFGYWQQIPLLTYKWGIDVPDYYVEGYIPNHYQLIGRRCLEQRCLPYGDKMKKALALMFSFTNIEIPYEARSNSNTP